MKKNENKQKILMELFEKLKLHYKRQGYLNRRKRRTNPMWGVDPKRIKEIE